MIKSEDTTDSKFGFVPSKRPSDQYIEYGTINLDKTAGPTSHEVAAWVKRIMGLKRIGHGGTLEAV